MVLDPINVGAVTALARILWPEFKVVDDLVFFAWAAPESVDLSKWQDRTAVEASLNHTHVLDLFEHGAGLGEEPWWNQDHPDFKAACEFGVLWAEVVAAKLSRDFPERTFLVYYAEQDNPVVRFHQEHPGESQWASPEDYGQEIAAGSVVIHRVCPVRFR